MILDLKTKTFSVEAFDADISGTENPVEISIMVGDSFFECAYYFVAVLWSFG
jgi:hypothetical protein